MKILSLFKQRRAALFDGTIVMEGDVVEFTNSDGDVCRDTIKRNINNNKLYFWNNTANISDYKSARKIS